MARRQPRCSEAGDRAEAQPHHRYPRHVRCRQPVRARTAYAAGEIGSTAGFDRLHRTSAARTFDHANDRQAEIIRHLFGHQRLGRDRRIGRAAAHGEVVADHDHGAAVDLAAAEHAVRRCQMPEFVVFVVFTDAGDGADLVEAFLVNDLVDALPNGEPALVMLTLDLVNASHLARERFAPGEVVEFRLPVHSYPPS